MMGTAVEALILDLLQWVGSGGREYLEVMEAWRTSCPRLPVWEEANDRGLVAIDSRSGQMMVRVTPAGAALLSARLCRI